MSDLGPTLLLLAVAALSRSLILRHPRHAPCSQVAAPSDALLLPISPRTRFILSTSGRAASSRRYRALLRDVLRLDAAYLPFSAPSGGAVSAHRFVAALRGLNCLGGAISRDIKAAILPLLDEVEPLAAACGSVNTVVVRGERLLGFNTDALGFARAIAEGTRALPRRVAKAVVYGYGGVAGTVAAVLRREGVEVRLTGRCPQRAAARAAQLGLPALEPSWLPADLLVNAAPGVTEDPALGAPHLRAALEGVVAVFDHEMPGEGLRDFCAARGVAHIPGTAMYGPQMVAQWALLLEGVVPAGTDVDAALAAAEAVVAGQGEGQ